LQTQHLIFHGLPACAFTLELFHGRAQRVNFIGPAILVRQLACLRTLCPADGLITRQLRRRQALLGQQ
jgi:hypothetical protein